jgi:hypothetical protein
MVPASNLGNLSGIFRLEAAVQWCRASIKMTNKSHRIALKQKPQDSSQEVDRNVVLMAHIAFSYGHLWGLWLQSLLLAHHIASFPSRASLIPK